MSSVADVAAILRRSSPANGIDEHRFGLYDPNVLESLSTSPASPDFGGVVATGSVGVMLDLSFGMRKGPALTMPAAVVGSAYTDLGDGWYEYDGTNVNDNLYWAVGGQALVNNGWLVIVVEIKDATSGNASIQSFGTDNSATNAGTNGVHEIPLRIGNGNVGWAGNTLNAGSKFKLHGMYAFPGNHLEQNTAAEKPTLQQDANGNYYLLFDGVDDEMHSDQSVSVDQTPYQGFVGYTNSVVSGNLAYGGIFRINREDRLNEIGTTDSVMESYHGNSASLYDRRTLISRHPSQRSYLDENFFTEADASIPVACWFDAKDSLYTGSFGDGRDRKTTIPGQFTDAAVAAGVDDTGNLFLGQGYGGALSSQRLYALAYTDGPLFDSEIEVIVDYLNFYAGNS